MDENEMDDVFFDCQQLNGSEDNYTISLVL